MRAEPAYSNDGNQTAYSELTSPLPGHTIHVMNADGSNDTVVSALIPGTLDLEPDWQPVNTPLGAAIVPLLGGISTPFGIEIIFFNVTTPGNTTAVLLPTDLPPPPSGFEIAGSFFIYELQTTAVFDPPVNICIRYDESLVSDEASLEIHRSVEGIWVPLPTMVDVVADIVCALSPGLSLFAIMEPVGSSVGGIAGLLDSGGLESATTSEPGSDNIGYLAALAGVIGATLIAGGWYARRRWSR